MALAPILMEISSTNSHRGHDSHVIPWVRVFLFYLLWIVLAGAGTAELIVGIPAAALSGWLSAKLLPASGMRWRSVGVALFCARFVRDSVVAGFEISLIALRPKLQIDPGFVTHRSHIPGGALRGFFNSYNSLTPGTLAIEPESEDILAFHCLDVGHPVAESLRENENALLRAIETSEEASRG